MKRIIFFSITIILFLAELSSSQDKGFGLGVILGEPTGVSAKNWITNTTAIDAAIAWSFVDQGALHIHADYLFNNFELIKLDSKAKIPVYYGAGIRIKFGENDTQLALRIPVGIDYLFGDAPVDIFLEVVPMLEIIPETKFQFNAAIGARYYFP